MNVFEPGKVYPGLSSGRVKVTYGNRSLESIIKSLIELDIRCEPIYKDTGLKRKRG